MTDSTRQELFEVLTEISRYFPDWRFAQTIAILSSIHSPDAPHPIWDVEDEELLIVARQQLEHFRQTQPAPGGLLAAGRS